MFAQGIKTWWVQFVNAMNAKGIPVPLIRDAQTQQGSMSLTLVFISFNVWLVSVIGKFSGLLGGINTGETLNMFLACAGLYWGRKFQKDGPAASLTDKVP